MINFKSITYKNFLSTGDQPTTIELNKTITSIFIGVNGGGKSTFIDAIVYALFGKPFRKVRLGQLINNVNEKGLECEVQFSIGSKQYRVNRGMKPSLFEIHVDGELIPQPATTADYQLILENEILKLNYKSFTQIIVLGSASFKPFMQLSLGDRREIIEDLLDISVFSEMNLILKGKIKECKGEILDIEHNIELVKERHSSKRLFLKGILDGHELWLKGINEKITDINISLIEDNKQKNDYDQQIVILESSITSLGDVSDKLKDIQTIINELNMDIFTGEQAHEKAVMDSLAITELQTKIDTNKSRIVEGTTKLGVLEGKLADVVVKISEYGEFNDRDDVKSSIAINKNQCKAEKVKLKFYEEHDDCPECKQGIEPMFREETINGCETAISEFEKAVTVAEDRLEVIEREMKEKNDYKLVKDDHEKNITIYKNALSNLESTNKTLQEDIDSRDVRTPDEISKLQDFILLLNTSLAVHTEDIVDLKKDNDKLTKVKEELTLVQKRKAVCEQSIKSNEVNLEANQKELKELEKPKTEETQGEIDALSLEIKEQDDLLSKKVLSLHYFGIVQKLLKDDGLKTKIIKKFLPIINATTNMYLDKFDFPINFTFDENFNETIQSNYRNDFCYYSFSEGEKARIDLALLFTWREIALKKSRNATNIIIFDEIFDGSLDGEGIENFMSILGLDKEGYNSFIISHKDETINSRFDRTMKFVKDGHFSKMVEN